jgi:osmotically-inducible protein OsmY
MSRLAGISKAGLYISVESGWATLKGEVDSFWKKVRAEELASIATGVTGVTNELTVVPTEKAKDKQIAEAVMKALERNTYLDINSVHVKVEKGIVFISGTVRTWKARTSANRAVENIFGVRDIENNLELQPER